MCGRFVSYRDLEALRAHFPIDRVEATLSPNYNVAPTQMISAIVRQDDENVLRTFRWGLVPLWAKDPSIGNRMINARSETVDSKPSFRNAFRKRRCLIPADGFYEWAVIPGEKMKQPYFIQLKGKHLFAFAGLWSEWEDPASGRILFPAEEIDRAVAAAPESFTLFDRDGAAHAEVGGWHVNFVPGSSGLKIMDHRTGETRLAATADYVEYVRLADGMEHLGYLATAFSTNRDIEPQVSDAWRLYLSLTNSRRPLVSGAFSEHCVPRMASMMRLFRESDADMAARPMSVFTITATGNFRYGEDSCQNLMDCIEAGIPVEIVPVTLMGLIAPVTLVGALVFHCVDVLTGLTMAQILRPGHPVLLVREAWAMAIEAVTTSDDSRSNWTVAVRSQLGVSPT